VLCELGAKVFSIERQRLLFDKTKNFLPKLNYQPKLFYGDGYLGLPTFAPFHKVIVTAGAPYIPEPLKEQLLVGGKLIIPVGVGETQIMHEIIKVSASNYEVTTHGKFKFVPLLEQKAN
jgi:protein-L-isoaspartate(D-aspartate) O-methyltransferase